MHKEGRKEKEKVRPGRDTVKRLGGSEKRPQKRGRSGQRIRPRETRGKGQR